MRLQRSDQGLRGGRAHCVRRWRLLSALAIASISLAIFVTGYAVFLLLSHQLGRRLAAPWHLHPGGTAAVSFIVKTATILVLVFMVKQG